MRRWAALFIVVAMSLPAATPVAAAPDDERMDMYSAIVDAATAAALADDGYDVVDLQPQLSGDIAVTLVLTNRERAALARDGVNTKLVKDNRGRSSRQRAAEEAANGFEVWRPWDGPGGIREELYDFAKKNAGWVKLVVLGKTYQGREIIAIKMTQGARGIADGRRPSALYISNQHAREWISVEVNRRLMHWFMDQRKAANPEIIKLLQSTELWFIISANPDGYQYTFESERLWRKNLRDNNGDGVPNFGDGVDPNRNWNEHWNYDREGSSGIPSSETYRGPAPESEPETQAAAGLMRLIEPEFLVNWHSFGPLILYPQGWQVGTPDADNPIYVALAGTDANPGIPGFDPGNSADELYVTNGETTDFANLTTDTIAFTPELNEGCPGCGFVFPDDEALVQAEFENARPFALDIALSAVDPENPVSHIGNTVEPFYLSQLDVDPENSAISMFDFRFEQSYGDPQEVRVLAKRSLGDVTVRYRINGGGAQSAPTSEWTGGDTYGPGNGTYYRVMAGTVSGTSAGDSVEVWFEGGGETSDSFTYEVASDSGAGTLILAAEDYTGASGTVGAGPFFLSYYEDALNATGTAYDVYDIDAAGRTAPDFLGVLSHYDTVIWYTGNDIVTREPGWPGGNASVLGIRTLYEVRDYMNEGGTVLYTGKWAGQQFTLNVGAQYYDPFDNAQCTSSQEIFDRCRLLVGSGNFYNDVIEYWFGAAISTPNAGFDPTGDPYPISGIDDPFLGLTWDRNGPDSAQNQDRDTSFIATSGLLPIDEYPQFESWPVARYLRPGAAFEPHTGDYYVYSSIADIAYKRLQRTISVPAGGATMSFWASYDTEADWDYLFVEAHTVGQDNWTTLPDMNGHSSTDTGLSCPSGWHDLHPFLEHYQTLNPDGTCSPTGTTGSWNATSGSSGGWQQWQVNLAAYAGQQIEVSITYATDWATQNLGVFIDDIVVSTGEGSTSFETGLDGWTITGPPPGSGPNENNWERITAAGLPEGAVIATPKSLFMGFGLEGVSDAAVRADLLDRSLDFLD